VTHSFVYIDVNVKIINYGRRDANNVSVIVYYSDLELVNGTPKTHFTSISAHSVKSTRLRFKVNKPSYSFIHITMLYSSKIIEKKILVESKYYLEFYIERICVETDHNLFGPGRFYVIVKICDEEIRYPKRDEIKIEGDECKEVNALIYKGYINETELVTLSVFEKTLFKKFDLGSETIVLPFNVSYALVELESSEIYISTRVFLQITKIVKE